MWEGRMEEEVGEGSRMEEEVGGARNWGREAGWGWIEGVGAIMVEEKKGEYTGN